MKNTSIPNTFTNPVIPGFYSDPSICRDGSHYYAAFSSFEYYPGVPLFHSCDLINWKQISYCLASDSQLSLEDAVTSDGIYAPTLRLFNHKFYMITSNRCSKCGNHFYVTASRPEGPYSEPVWITDHLGNSIGGVDPSLFFDADGSVYFSCVAWDKEGQGIGQACIDLDTGKLREPLRIIWHGTGRTFPEGPHTYLVNGWYYLMIAEGGTEYGHQVSIARSRNIRGPYEPCPHNPVLSQNYQIIQSGCIQGTGHGDLFQAHDGTWWLIVHGFRTSLGKLHHLGRETMLVPITWDEEEWPVVNQNGCIGESTSLQGVFSNVVQEDIPDFTDDFSSDTLDMQWNFLRNPRMQNYHFPAANGKGVILVGTANTLNEEKSPVWLGIRQRHFNCSVEIRMTFTPSESDEAGFTVYQTPEHHYDVAVTSENGKTVCFLRKKVGDIEWTGEKMIMHADTFIIQMFASRTGYHFSVLSDGKEYRLGSGRTQLLSTEAMQYQNFTGTFLALYATSPNPEPVPAHFTFFQYRSAKEF